jgi:hypothetical protein
MSSEKKPPAPTDVQFSTKTRAKFLSETVRQTNEAQRSSSEQPGFVRGARVRKPQ